MSRKPRLGINIDHVATIRQLRRGSVPDPVYAALVAEENGADQITCHLREDRRHIHERDILSLRSSIKTLLNIESSLSDDILSFVLEVSPNSICLVPERREELTTEGGLDVISNEIKLASVIPLFIQKSIKVSLFVDPDISQIRAAADLGANSVELHTGCYANSLTPRERDLSMQQLFLAGKYAVELGLGVHAGHGLDYGNVLPILSIPGISELNIGYAVIVRSLDIGWAHAVAKMKSLIT
ncbi:MULTISPECIES: pyridoxine 5'-phosphate synthase [Candidatus Ichthyocystis]|uniref:pyridoxine 5'-phosphate synthase n=1 Tax=Candidatus Ichthyocystis TaxID=2929841 RepID=UPI000A5B86C1|nr:MULTISPECIES: pyridoxine 5'-phosphate synthase [Ichthyocystis]